MVSQPIISTKINIPSVQHRLVQRQRLFDRLNEGLNSKLTVICAPAGYGKSTLITQWLGTRKERAAWVSLDKNDDDWIRFFTYLVTAIVNSGSDIGTSGLGLLNSGRPVAMNELMVNIINDFAAITRDTIVVLDDFHLIKSADIVSDVSSLIENLPPQLRLFILSRSEPELPIAKFRSQRELTELQASDLQFSLPEVETFLNQIMNLDLRADDVSILADRTEGWVVGLQLVALSLRQRSDTSLFITSLTGKDRHIADYLVDEVLSRQTKDFQSFLLQTSIFERLCGSLCDEVLGIQGSQAILEKIERANLFIIPLDNSREWYRYHHLFAQLLRSRLERENIQLVKDLQRKASVWCQTNDLLEEGVRYAFAAEDYSVAASIVERIGHPTYWANQNDKLREWLQSLPSEFIGNSFELQILHAYDQINMGKVREADLALQELEQNFENYLKASDDGEKILRGKLSSAWTSIKIHRYMAWSDCYQMAKQSLDLLPSKYWYERCVAYFHGGGALIYLGELEKAEAYLANARRLSDSVKNPFAKLITLSNQGTLMMVRNRLKDAIEGMREAHEFAKQCRASQEATYSSAVIGIASIYYEWDKLDQCREYLDEAIEITEKYSFFDRILLNHETLIKYFCAKNDFLGAEESLKRCHKILTDNGITEAADRRLKTLYAWLNHKKGDVEETTAWASKFIGLTGEEISFELEPGMMLYARIRLSEGHHGQAIHILQKLLALAKTQGRLKSALHITILLSAAYSRTKDPEMAQRFLMNALRMARPEGYIRSFIDEGVEIETELKRLISNQEILDEEQPLVEYAKSLLKSFYLNSVESEDKSPTESTASDAITPKEREVLQLLDQGMTYAEIAADLDISENTLKFHIKNIYGKLSVNKRIKAVAEAKRLGFL